MLRYTDPHTGGRLLLEYRQRAPIGAVGRVVVDLDAIPGHTPFHVSATTTDGAHIEGHVVSIWRVDDRHRPHHYRHWPHGPGYRYLEKQVLSSAIFGPPEYRAIEATIPDYRVYTVDYHQGIRTALEQGHGPLEPPRWVDGTLPAGAWPKWAHPTTVFEYGLDWRQQKKFRPADADHLRRWVDRLIDLYAIRQLVTDARTRTPEPDYVGIFVA